MKVSMVETWRVRVEYERWVVRFEYDGHPEEHSFDAPVGCSQEMLMNLAYASMFRNNWCPPLDDYENFSVSRAEGGD